MFDNKSAKKKKKWTPPSFIPLGQLMTNVSGVIDKTGIISGKLIEEWLEVFSKPSYIKKLIKRTSSRSVDTAKAGQADDTAV
ncbi:MAG: hypothetical protein R2874_06080 [Desulfobacterales bacterium]